MCRSVLMEPGDGFVTVAGEQVMLKLFVDNLVLPQMLVCDDKAKCVSVSLYIQEFIIVNGLITDGLRHPV